MARAYHLSKATIPKYKTPEEMQGLIDQYFEDCKGTVLTDAGGNVVYDKYGMPVVIDRHPPTTAGLSLALGFTSREAIYRYKAKPAFKQILALAKLRIEQYTEERLFDRDGSAGAKFSLQNNFDGWDRADLKKAEASAPTVNIVCDIPRGGAQVKAEVPEAPENEVIEEDVE